MKRAVWPWTPFTSAPAATLDCRSDALSSARCCTAIPWSSIPMSPRGSTATGSSSARATAPCSCMAGCICLVFQDSTSTKCPSPLLLNPRPLILFCLTSPSLPLLQVSKFRALHSMTPGHPEWRETPGVEATTGPLGQGTSNAVGYAVSQKMAAGKYNTAEHKIFSNKIFCLAGDGCMQAIGPPRLALCPAPPCPHTHYPLPGGRGYGGACFCRSLQAGQPCPHL